MIALSAEKRILSIHTPNRALMRSGLIRFGLNPSFDVRRIKRYAREKGTKKPKTRVVNKT